MRRNGARSASRVLRALRPVPRSNQGPHVPSSPPSDRPQPPLHPPHCCCRLSNDADTIDALFSTLAFIFKFLVKQIVVNFQVAPQLHSAPHSFSLSFNPLRCKPASESVFPERSASLRPNPHSSPLPSAPFHVRSFGLRSSQSAFAHDK